MSRGLMEFLINFNNSLVKVHGSGNDMFKHTKENSSSPECRSAGMWFKIYAFERLTANVCVLPSTESTCFCF